MSEAALRGEVERLRANPESVDLVDAALIVARVGRPQVDPEAVRSRLGNLANGVRARIADAGHPRARVEALCHALAVEAGFGGDPERYYEIDNSLLDRVLATRRGIPITLAVVYAGVGQAAGLACTGVNFPGHFLLRCADPDDPEARELIDPFSGRVLDVADAQALLRRALGPTVRLGPEHLTAASPLDVLVRMLNNLRQLAVAEARFSDALRLSELIGLAEPGRLLEHGERAALHERLGNLDEALAELTLLATALDASDAADPTLRERVERARSRLVEKAGGRRTLH